MQISEVMKRIRKINYEHGFSSNGRDLFCEKMLLIISEISEATEEFRNNRGLKEVYAKDGKPEGIPIEIADALIRIFDWCEHNEVDIEEAIRLKLEYNESRPYRHGNKVI